MVEAKHLFNRRWKIVLGTLTVLSTLFFFLGYEVHFFDGPYGMHFMRQTDSLSFVSQYFNNGYDFFNPKLFNLKNIDGRAACEFPITYYFTALLYSILGPKIYLLKLLHLIVSFSGLFYVFRLAFLILQDYLYAILTALFLCTSTVYNFYAFNYLPDTPALAFIFMAWYYVFRYQTDGKRTTAAKAFVLFTLGSLIKVTYLINPIALLIYYIFMYIYKKEHLQGLKNKGLILKYGSINLMLVLSWNAYILYYNQQYDSYSFNTAALPIWDLAPNAIMHVWDFVVDFWYTSYFAHSSFHLLIILALVQLILMKKNNYNITLIVGLLFLGSICFGLLFYTQFKDHDYYFLTFMPFIILLFINGINTLKNNYQSYKFQWILKCIIAIIVVAGINYSKKKLTERYQHSMDEYSRMGLLISKHKMEIEHLEIPKDAKVILAPEPSQNGGLFYINRMGWTFSSIEEISKKKLRSLKDKGAEYLFLTKEHNDPLNTIDQEGEIILNNKDLLVFRLQ
mgnify:CR=1 FL=1